MKYIIVDLEATCWEGRGKQRHEIIEIGAVCVDDDQNTLDEFCAFVRPRLHPTLSDFCKQLTSIRQEQVDQAQEFPQVLTQFQAWIAGFQDEYLLCSWGHYDRSQFIRDCQLHGLDTAWVQRHISLKHQYGELKGQRRPPGMRAALQTENIPLEGTHHRGIDDARNIAKIFKKYFGLWKMPDG